MIFLLFEKVNEKEKKEVKNVTGAWRMCTWMLYE